MPQFPRCRPFAVFAVVCVALLPGDRVQAQVDFATQIKPLLSDRCFLCHGPDAENRQAGLRLDSEEGVKAPLESDGDLFAVVPGKPEASELVARITTSDADLKMPPADSGLSLSKSEQDLLTEWVKQGAEWKGHWAFEPIVSPPLPDVKNAEWCRNPIDRFIVAKQEAAGFAQNSMASKERLIRRATFDLTGLPPTVEEIDEFLADTSEGAFEHVVDRLLASENFGERMTADWLDAARYSDTYGYQVDRDRFVWPWRDWVVNAVNSNMPYDRFIVEQLAGDMLPNATREQKLATTFNRLHPQKVEGGSVPEEFRVEYVADRAQTVATAFMGLTFECARCHDHKYDPISQREYFQLYSFFNNIDEAGLYSFFTSSVPTPTLRLPTDDQSKQLADASAKVVAAEQALQQRWEQLHQPDVQSQLLKSVAMSPPSLESLGQVASFDFDSGNYGANKLVDSPRGKAVQLTGDHAVDVKVGNFARWQPFTVATWLKAPQKFERSVVFHRSRAWTDAASRGYELLIEDGKLSAALIHFWPGNAVRIVAKNELPINEWVHVAITYDGSSKAAGLKIWVNGQAIETEVVRDNLYKNITGGGGDNINIGERFRDKGFAKGQVDDFKVFERELTPLEVQHLFTGQAASEALSAAVDSATPAEPELVRFAMAVSDPVYKERLDNLQSAREAFAKLQDSVQEIMAMNELPTPRQAYVLTRGAYDAHGDPVSSDVPAALPPRREDMPPNRLGLARWLTSDEHPLTARVAVNRFWQACFGNGLVRTPEDFGSQGMAPTHPELLDWLADDFRRHGWDVKRLLKQMLMSATYQQSSEVDVEQHRKDPENLLLSHAPVYRLTAEMLRDNALATSGLLKNQLGGAPVRPYELAASFKPSTPDKGAGLYRRSLYTYWKRTAPAPMMMTLDANKREVCRVKRERTASPLQSLVVMNGPQFVEAARALADTLMQKHDDDNNAILTDMFRRLTSRQPSDHERDVLLQLQESQQTHFANNAEEADKYLSVGDAKPASTNKARLAAWASVANTLYAFDECMMKR